MKMTYETERKFLLKKLPKIDYINESEIKQYYFDNLDFRLRKEKSKNEIIFTKTQKTKVTGVGVQENETQIDSEEFHKILSENKKYRLIKKNRYYCSKENTIIIDLYKNLTLIVCEIEVVGDLNNKKELDNILYSIKIPDYIDELIIREVTGDVNFSNRNLALPK